MSFEKYRLMTDVELADTARDAHDHDMDNLRYKSALGEFDRRAEAKDTEARRIEDLKTRAATDSGAYYELLAMGIEVDKYGQ